MRCLKVLEKYSFNDENCKTKSSRSQENVERYVSCFFNEYVDDTDPNKPKFNVELHSRFLDNNLKTLSQSYESLDCSRIWLCYWILHSNYLIGRDLDLNTISDILRFLKSCQSATGGFGGGPNQDAHLATTYAAINAVCTIQTKEAYDLVNRATLKNFLWSVKQVDGSFAMHVGGECDIRGIYCALTIAKLMNIDCNELFANSVQWLSSCQTYEGGFGGTPDTEAHGGYTFCGLAALILLQKGHMCDAKALLKWLVNKQKSFEGGFCGRTNKLVDSCYSFWIGGSFPLVHSLLSNQIDDVPGKLLFNEEALQEYLLVCCQHIEGGMIDKPGKKPDGYHTCYSLSGLSISQLSLNSQPFILGDGSSRMKSTHPLYNISPESVAKVIQYFENKPMG